MVNYQIISSFRKAPKNTKDPGATSYLAGNLLTRNIVKLRDLKFEKCDFPRLKPYRGPSQQSFEKKDEYDHNNFERKGFRLFCKHFVLDLVASDYVDWLHVFEHEMDLERIPYSVMDTDQIIGKKFQNLLSEIVAY